MADTLVLANPLRDPQRIDAVLAQVSKEWRELLAPAFDLALGQSPPARPFLLSRCYKTVHDSNVSNMTL
jgi:hypothetical protein